MASLANTRPETNGVDPAPPPELEVRAQLERILASAGFVASERLCRFLRWAVEHTLAGDTGALKGYSLGRDVFDRRDDYDPKVDSIVRVEAQRLRRKLRQYYSQEGGAQPVRIEIPPRGYVPVFRWAPAAARVRGPLANLDPLIVAVLPFVRLGPDADENLLCDGIVEEILTELARAPELKVLARGSGSSVQNTELDAREIGRRLGAVHAGARQRAQRRWKSADLGRRGGWAFGPIYLVRRFRARRAGYLRRSNRNRAGGIAHTARRRAAGEGLGIACPRSGSGSLHDVSARAPRMAPHDD